MSNLLQSYLSLSPLSPRAEVSHILQSITAASPTFTEASRKQLVSALLEDLRALHRSDQGCRIVAADAAHNLSTLKVLCRNETGSQVIAQASNLSFLLLMLTSTNFDPAVGDESLRCVANALLLIEEARVTWVGESVAGGSACVDLLQDHINPNRLFLVARILFLCTASRSQSSSFISWLVDERHGGSSIMDIIGAKLDALLPHVQQNQPMAPEAMADLLKFLFNLLTHYPKLAHGSISGHNDDRTETEDLIDDNWSPELESILPVLLRNFHALSHPCPLPLAPPLTHIIHALITIPVSANLHAAWFPLPDADRSAHSPTAQPVLDDVMTMSSPMQSRGDVLYRAYCLLDASLAYHLPCNMDPDDQAVRSGCQISLDDTLRPLTLLITRLCLGDATSRARARNWLLPYTLDRTSPLEARPDTLGRCLRLLGSVYHPNLKDAIGEMLFAICDSDAATLCSLVGYGNVAGFLFNKGVTAAPPRSTTASLTTPSGVPINPITGVIERGVPQPEMTNEEKEIEAEKLFVLFDRLEKTGIIQPSQNPIRMAMQG